MKIPYTNQILIQRIGLYHYFNIRIRTYRNNLITTDHLWDKSTKIQTDYHTNKFITILLYILYYSKMQYSLLQLVKYLEVEFHSIRWLRIYWRMVVADRWSVIFRMHVWSTTTDRDEDEGRTRIESQSLSINTNISSNRQLWDSPIWCVWGSGAVSAKVNNRDKANHSSIARALAHTSDAVSNSTGSNTWLPTANRESMLITSVHFKE